MKYGGADTARRVHVTDDYRGPFGRDRDRVLYSSAFRRLAGKTQVVAVGELGDFHTRMTHTLKVAQLGRRLAERLQRTAADTNQGTSDPKVAPCSPDLVEAACLAHDLGHPPFGHAGEEALMRSVDAILRDRGQSEEQIVEFGGFEGNAQTFRIVGELSVATPAEASGLDLTRATLDATIKYPWFRGAGGEALRKWNAYPQDAELFSWVREGHETGPEAPKCFEAQLMDWCDDVTYATHDVEDFFRAGLIPLADLFAQPINPQDSRWLSNEAQQFLGYLEKKEGEKSNRAGEGGEEFDLEEATAIWKDLSQLYLISGPYQPSRASKLEVHHATSRAITYLTAATRCVGDAPMRYEGKLAVDEEGQERRRKACNMLQQLIWYYVIEQPALATQQFGQQRIVRDLLNIFADESNDRLLPPEQQQQVEAGADHLRVAVDYVASLTEPRAEAMHQRLTGIRAGQLSDPIW